MKIPDYKMITNVDNLGVTSFVKKWEDDETVIEEFDPKFGIEILDGSLKHKCFQYLAINLKETNIEINVMEYDGLFENPSEEEIPIERYEVYVGILLDLIENGILSGTTEQQKCET